MAKINKKTVDWVCKIMRQDAFKNSKKDNPDLGYLPAAKRVQQRLTKGFLSIPKKDLNNKNQRTRFMMEAMTCADTICKSFDTNWTNFNCFENNYYSNVDKE